MFEVFNSRTGATIAVFVSVRDAAAYVFWLHTTGHPEVDFDVMTDRASSTIRQLTA